MAGIAASTFQTHRYLVAWQMMECHQAESDGGSSVPATNRGRVTIRRAGGNPHSAGDTLQLSATVRQQPRYFAQTLPGFRFAWHLRYHHDRPGSPVDADHSSVRTKQRTKSQT